MNSFLHIFNSWQKVDERQDALSIIQCKERVFFYPYCHVLDLASEGSLCIYSNNKIKIMY